MTRAALYELLTGHFADGRPVDSVSERTQLALSVTDHLGRLLNSRQGALRAAPDYGLPDTNLIYANQATAREQLRAAIATTILRHEPRVSAVQVRAQSGTSHDFVHGYHITCQLRRDGTPLELEGWLRADGRLQLQPRGPDANTRSDLDE